MRLVMIFIFCTLSACASMARNANFGEHFVVDSGRYAGTWFEAARTPNSFEDNTPTRDGVTLSACFNTTATYEVIAPDRISVLNRCQRRTSDGEIVVEEIEGEARIRPDTDNRQLNVAFGGKIARFFQRLIGSGDYRIYCLDPTSGEAPYNWAVISGPDKGYIFVLSRDTSAPEEALACARQEGLPVDTLIFAQE